jgi:hypothetical protein
LRHQIAIIKQKVTRVKELTEAPNPPETQKVSEKPPLKRIRKRATSRAIAQAVVDNAINDKAIKGSSRTGARVIVELPGAQLGPPETRTKKKRGPQPWVKRICSEPEWTGPWEDEDTQRDASKLPLSEPDVPAD